MIGTHNGKFHADEALACYMLQQHPDFKDYPVVRSRDPKVLEECHVLVDVGGIFNHETRRYDHHQPDFKHTMRTLKGIPYDTLLSSAGLVFAFYGRRVIAKRLNLNERSEKVTMIFSGLYKGFIEEIDRVDNGLQLLPDRKLVAVGRCKLVGELNPNGKKVSDALYDERFHQASALIGSEFLKCIDQLAKGLQISRPNSDNEIAVLPRERRGSDTSGSCLEQNEYYVQVWWPAGEIVEKALDNRHDNHKSGQIVVLPDNNGVRGIPWKTHFFYFEELKGLRNWNILYAVYHNEIDQLWIVHCIPESRSEKFSARRYLPKAWSGLNNEDLSRKTGIDGCVFVHNCGYIAGNRTKSGALQMAICAVEGRRRQQQRPSNSHLAIAAINRDISHNNLHGGAKKRLSKKKKDKCITSSVFPSPPNFCHANRFDVLR